MAELGYFEPIPGIYGTANPATDSNPEARAALQEQYALMQQERTGTAGYIPPTYLHQGAPGNLPVIGWTAQNAENPQPFHPYSNKNIGRTPDWDGDPNPIAAGAYDQNEAVRFTPVNPLNRAPIGELDPLPIDQPNPNFLPQDQGGTIDLEW